MEQWQESQGGRRAWAGTVTGEAVMEQLPESLCWNSDRRACVGTVSESQCYRTGTEEPLLEQWQESLCWNSIRRASAGTVTEEPVLEQRQEYQYGKNIGEEK